MGMWSQIGSAILTQGGADWEMGLSLIGAAISQGNYDQAKEIYDTIVRSIGDEQIPEFQKAVAQEVQARREIPVQSEGRSAQSSAIRQLGNFVDQGGLDAQARAQNQQVLSAADQREKGQREAITSGMARRGMGGSGAELAAQLQGQQASANQARNAGLDIAGQARSRALQALGQQASIGGQMRGQDFSIENANAAAEREREMFNAKMRSATQQYNNTGAMENAQLRLAKLAQMNAARRQVAGNEIETGNRVRKDYAGVGRGINYKHQAASEDMEGMPF